MDVVAVPVGRREAVLERRMLVLLLLSVNIDRIAYLLLEYVRRRFIFIFYSLGTVLGTKHALACIECAPFSLKWDLAFYITHH